MTTVEPIPTPSMTVPMPSVPVGHYVSFRDDASHATFAAGSDTTSTASLSHWSPTVLPSASPAVADIPQITPSLSPGLRPKEAAVVGVSATMSPNLVGGIGSSMVSSLMGPPASPSLGAAATAAPPSQSPPFNPNLSPLQQPISRISPSMSPSMSPTMVPVMLPPPAVMVDQLPVNSAFASAISLASAGATLNQPINQDPLEQGPQAVDGSQAPNAGGEASHPAAMIYEGVGIETGSVSNPSPNAVSIAFSPTQLTRLADQPVEPLQLPNPHMFPGVYPYTTFGVTSQRRFITPSHDMYKSNKMSKPASQSRKPAKSQGARSTAGRKGAAANGEKPTRRFCHICRSPKEVAKIVSCCSGKQSHVFCAGCVHRRLKLSFEELVQRNDWLCPKCENRCPCSKCRKRIPVVPAAPPPL